MLALSSSPALAKACLIVRQSARSFSPNVGGTLDRDALSDTALPPRVGATPGVVVDAVRGSGDATASATGRTSDVDELPFAESRDGAERDRPAGHRNIADDEQPEPAMPPSTAIGASADDGAKQSDDVPQLP